MLEMDRGQDRSAPGPAGRRSAQAEAGIHDLGTGAGRSGAFPGVPGQPPALDARGDVAGPALPARRPGQRAYRSPGLRHPDRGHGLPQRPGGDPGRWPIWSARAVDNPTALAQAMLSSLNSTFRVAPEMLKTRAEDFTFEKAAREYMGVV